MINGTFASPDKRILHHAGDDWPPHDLSLSINDRVFQPGILLGLFQAG